ncbi:MAG: hypothetical protein ABL984_20265 [Pyrinomonadaceae bacterium]
MLERGLSEIERANIAGHKGLTDVLAWAATKPKADVHPHIVAEVITQDEFTHDVIVPYRDVFLVYDTT